jgi:hypothetical protein
MLRRAALIPEQTLLGLALAGDPEFRSMDETWRNLELGREFCRVFQELATEGDAYRPRDETSGMLASTIQAFISVQELHQWAEAMTFVRAVLDELVQRRTASVTEIKAASDRMQEFASFAKHKAALTSGWDKP